MAAPPPIMTALPISPATSAQSPAPAKPGSAPRAGSSAKSFAEVLENSGSAKAVSGRTAEKLAKESIDNHDVAVKTVSSKDEKTQSAKEAHEPSAALTLLSAIQPQQHLPMDARSWSLSLPKKEQAPVASTQTDKKSTDAEEPAATAAGSPPQITGKQQIAFGATLSKTESHVDTAAVSKLQPTISAPGADEKSNQSKQHFGSSNSGHESSSSKDSQADKAAATAITPTPNASTQFHVPAASTGSSVASTTHVAAAYTPAIITKTAQPAAADRAVEIKEPVATAVPRSPSIDLQTGDVNVRVSQRAGDVQITVRTADNDMAQSLRQHLPELADKLTQNGVHADLWQPSTAQSAASDHGADSSSNQNSQQQDSQSRQQSGTPEDRQDRQQRRQDWQEEFSSAATTDR